jgi:hypothetical protein
VIFIVVKHPVRPEYSDDWPSLVEEFAVATRAEPGTFASIGSGTPTTPTCGCRSRHLLTPRRDSHMSDRLISRLRSRVCRNGLPVSPRLSMLRYLVRVGRG